MMVGGSKAELLTAKQKDLFASLLGLSGFSTESLVVQRKTGRSDPGLWHEQFVSLSMIYCFLDSFWNHRSNTQHVWLQRGGTISVRVPPLMGLHQLSHDSPQALQVEAMIVPVVLRGRRHGIQKKIVMKRSFSSIFTPFLICFVWAFPITHFLSLVIEITVFSALQGEQSINGLFFYLSYKWCTELKWALKKQKKIGYESVSQSGFITRFTAIPELVVTR